MQDPAQLEHLTGGPDAPTQLLYFTTPSVTTDGRTLVVVRDEDGNPNLWAIDLGSGHSRRLTDQREGILKSYVYFRGRPNRGFGKASVTLDPVRGRVYWIQGTEIRSVGLAAGERERVLARLPEDQVTAFMHVSADGRRLCVPTTDARALEENAPAAPRSGENTVAGRRNEVITDKPAYDIDARVQREGLSSWLRVFDTETGELTACERVPRGWVTHVQFSPVRSDWILYNHEWPSDCGVRRLWLWDGQIHRPLRTEEAANPSAGSNVGPAPLSAIGLATADAPPLRAHRSRADWVCHEMWEADGRGIIYHGKFADGVAFIGRVSPAGGDNVEIALPREYSRYGHFTAGTRHVDWLVSDGYWHPAGEAENGLWGGEWLTRLQVDWARGRIEWTPLCRHHSAWDCQDSHPHPVFGPGDRDIYFTSNRGGGRSVCRVALP